MVRKVKGEVKEKVSFENTKNKKEMYEAIKGIKEFKEVFQFMDGTEDCMDSIGVLVSAIAMLNAEGFTLSTAIKRDTGEIFTTLFSLKEQKAYDLECSLVLASKIIEHTDGFSIDQLKDKIN